MKPSYTYCVWSGNNDLCYVRPVYMNFTLIISSHCLAHAVIRASCHISPVIKSQYWIKICKWALFSTDSDSSLTFQLFLQHDNLYICTTSPVFTHLIALGSSSIVILARPVTSLTRKNHLLTTSLLTINHSFTVSLKTYLFHKSFRL